MNESVGRNLDVVALKVISEVYTQKEAYVLTLSTNRWGSFRNQLHVACPLAVVPSLIILVNLTSNNLGELLHFSSQFIRRCFATSACTAALGVALQQGQAYTDSSKRPFKCDEC